MADLLYLDPGGIEIKTPSGEMRFSTSEPMLHITNTVNGSLAITFPFMPASQQFNRTTSYSIASVQSGATHVFGVLRTASDSYSRLQNNTWYDASGTYLHRVHWMTDNQTDDGNRAITLEHFVHYTFRISGGTLFLDEVVHFDDYNTLGLQSQLPITLSNFTIFYKLKIGLFT